MFCIIVIFMSILSQVITFLDHTRCRFCGYGNTLSFFGEVYNSWAEPSFLDLFMPVETVAHYEDIELFSLMT